MKHILKSFVLLLLFAFVIPIGCSESDNQPVEPETKEETEPEIPQDSRCNEISLENDAYYPLDLITVSGIPEDLAEDLTVEIWHDGKATDFFMGVGIDLEGKHRIMAPTHPTAPVKGGKLEIVFRADDGTFVCEPLSVTILELPEAPGHIQEVSIALQEFIKQRMDYLGIDEEKMAGDLTNITGTELPFALVYNLLNNPESETALLPFLDNDKLYPWIEGTLEDKEMGIDLAGRLLKHYGFLDYLNSEIQAFEKNISNVTSKGTSTNLSAANPLILDCEGMNQDKLKEQFNNVALAKKITDSNGLTYLGFAAGLTGVVTGFVGMAPVAGIAMGVVGLGIFATQKVAEGYEKTRLSTFTKFELIVATEHYEEKACAPEPYYGNVWASSEGWSLDRTVAEALFHLGAFGLGSGLSLMAKTTAQTTRANAFATSTFLGSTQLDNIEDLGFYEGDKFKVEPVTCGPIEIDKSEYLFAQLEGDAFELDESKLDIIPKKAGTVSLKVGMAMDQFAGKTINKSETITINQPYLEWDPNFVILRVEPGDSIDINLNMHAVFNEKAHTAKADQGAIVKQATNAEGIGEFSYSWPYKIYTPSDKNAYPYYVTASFTSKECLRGKPDAEPVIVSLTIDTERIEIYPLEEGCLEAGNTRGFGARLSDPDLEVEWLATGPNGAPATIDQNGVFTATKPNGMYSITARYKKYPKIKDSYSIRVRPCDCYWSFSGGIYQKDYEQSWYEVYESQDGVTVSLFNTYDDSTTEDMALTFPLSLLPEEGETKGFNIDEQNDPGIALVGFDFPGTVAMYEGTYIELTMKNDRLEGYLMGKATGSEDLTFDFVLEFIASRGMLSECPPSESD